MSSPRRETLWISDVSGVQIGVIRSDLVELVHDDRLDTSEVLRFTIPASSTKAYLVEADNRVRWRDRRFIMSEIESNRDGSATTISVECEASWYGLGQDTRVGTFIIDGMSPTDGLAEILAGTGWAAADASTVGAFSLEADDASPLDLLRSWAKITGLSILFDPAGQTVSMSTATGADRGLGFRYRRNLRSVRRRERAPDVTRIYPFGADSLSIAGLAGAAYVEDLSYYTDRGVDLDAVGDDGRTNRERFTKSIVLSDSSFVNDADLYAWALTQLAAASQPIVTYELDVVDLSELSGVAETLRTGDSVRVADPAFELDVRTTVVRTERFPLDPSRNKVELAVLSGLTVDPSTTIGRGNAGDQWFQYVGPVAANFLVRNDATWTVARIPLRFRDGGRYHLGLDVSGTGVGAGVVTVQIYDDTNDVEVRSWSTTYSDGAAWRVFGSFAVENLPVGSRDYRLRVSTVADGGPSVSNGVDMVFEDEDASGLVSWWVMAQRAVRETPPGAVNSQTFAQSTALQTFVVPDNVTSISVTAKGGVGTAAGGSPGNGAVVQGSGFAVTPGETLGVVAGATGEDVSDPVFGGRAQAGAGNFAASGGGVSAVARGVTDRADFATVPDSDLLVVAGGGGGAGSGGEGGNGGNGGFFEAGDGIGWSSLAGFGGTQYAGGDYTDGIGTGAASEGQRFYGGIYNTTSSISKSGAAGGVGYYGGGSGAGYSGGGGGGGAGGGGSSYIDQDATDILITDGGNSGPGEVVISWEVPEV